ncbi:N-acetylmuramate alpha-1-phosphate uridylyltransferase MurU [Microbulbifer marinus]|uniref:MurNAc alpha-1-phosphate uridylyltransferase n=1 Tax=Microbulbifer marinus TaxID=658218 RepID=A0A1H4AYN2_9GAMM|nr:nucleotidyltransferase family protein [Microbulbifer marinus]SEA41033.1 MurNAc alpha-1-phosphate uridylyltransferase [Microbulbifer marinus]
MTDRTQYPIPTAMVLAAGFGKRMRPLTDQAPKPLLQVAGKPLIEYALDRLAAIGVQRVVINLGHLGHMIRAQLGGGERWGLEIRYSVEKEEEPLETAGGIIKALPLLGSDPFLVVNGDVWCDFDLARWLERPLPDGCPGRLLMVPNPPHNPEGDFGIDEGLLSGTAKPRYTFAGISWLRPEILTGYPNVRACFGLGEVFTYNEDKLQAELYEGDWCDVGTPERLQRLDQRLTSGKENN